MEFFVIEHLMRLNVLYFLFQWNYVKNLFRPNPVPIYDRCFRLTKKQESPWRICILKIDDMREICNKYLIRIAHLQGNCASMGLNLSLGSELSYLSNLFDLWLIFPMPETNKVIFTFPVSLYPPGLECSRD